MCEWDLLVYCKQTSFLLAAIGTLNLLSPNVFSLVNPKFCCLVKSSAQDFFLRSKFMIDYELLESWGLSILSLYL